jgi:hypothetical protein
MSTYGFEAGTLSCLSISSTIVRIPILSNVHRVYRVSVFRYLRKLLARDIRYIYGRLVELDTSRYRAQSELMCGERRGEILARTCQHIRLYLHLRFYVTLESKISDSF